jgi:hypothetical protein
MNRHGPFFRGLPKRQKQQLQRCQGRTNGAAENSIQIPGNACFAPEFLERATHSLAHRGPDDSGSIILLDAVPEPPGNWLCATRLAILDLSALGHQPMQDKATGNWIAYNGQIYNLREKLFFLCVMKVTTVCGIKLRFRGCRPVHQD